LVRRDLSRRRAIEQRTKRLGERVRQLRPDDGVDHSYELLMLDAHVYAIAIDRDGLEIELNAPSPCDGPAAVGGAEEIARDGSHVGVGALGVDSL
jgi:hypothetical protein